MTSGSVYYYLKTLREVHHFDRATSIAKTETKLALVSRISFFVPLVENEFSNVRSR